MSVLIWLHLKTKLIDKFVHIFLVACWLLQRVFEIFNAISTQCSASSYWIATIASSATKKKNFIESTLETIETFFTTTWNFIADKRLLPIYRSSNDNCCLILYWRHQNSQYKQCQQQQQPPKFNAYNHVLMNSLNE